MVGSSARPYDEARRGQPDHHVARTSSVENQYTRFKPLTEDEYSEFCEKVSDAADLAVSRRSCPFVRSCLSHAVITACIILVHYFCIQCLCLQCVDAVGWAAGRDSGL